MPRWWATGVCSSSSVRWLLSMDVDTVPVQGTLSRVKGGKRPSAAGP